MHSLSNLKTGQRPGMVLAAVLFALTTLLLLFGGISPASASPAAPPSAAPVNVASLALAARPAVPAVAPGASVVKVVELAQTTKTAKTAPSTPASQSHIVYKRGFSVQRFAGRSWLVFGWPNGIWHATTRFSRNAKGLLVSHSAFVPSQRSAASGLGSAQPAARPAVKKVSISLTAKSSHFVNRYPFGQCTWGAAQLRHNNAFDGLGNAADWNNNAPRHGLRVGYSPRVGAVVVFERGVQGASRQFGHVGVVTKILSGGRFVMEAMNDVAGFGHYGFRTVHTGSGVSFIY